MSGTELAKHRRMKKNPIAYHFAVHARAGWAPLLDRDRCVVLWRKLRERFPKVLASVLMPDHLQFVVDARTRAGPRELAATLRGWTRETPPGRRIWYPVDAPTLILDEGKLLRDIRYVHLNPCRDHLVADPLEWEWSTHLDAAGAIADPWLDLDRLAELLGCSRERLPERIHRYVSGDPSVRVAGTPAPTIAKLVAATPATVARAAVMALRAAEAEARGRFEARQLAVHLSATVPGIKPAAMRAELGLSKTAFHESAARTVAPSALRAGRLLLSDPRFWRKPDLAKSVTLNRCLAPVGAV